MAQNLELVTESQAVLKRDFEVDAGVAARLDPTNALSPLAGEFATLVTATTGTKAATKVTLGGLTGNLQTSIAGSTFPQNESLVHQIFTEKGRFDVQAISKLTVLWSYPYEAETNVYDIGTAIAVGQPLAVAVGSATVANRLVLQAVANNELVVAFAMNALATTDAPLGKTKLRFRYVGPTYVAVT